MLFWYDLKNVWTLETPCMSAVFQSVSFHVSAVKRTLKRAQLLKRLILGVVLLPPKWRQLCLCFKLIQTESLGAVFLVLTCSTMTRMRQSQSHENLQGELRPQHVAAKKAVGMFACVMVLLLSFTSAFEELLLSSVFSPIQQNYSRTIWKTKTKSEPKKLLWQDFRHDNWGFYFWQMTNDRWIDLLIPFGGSAREMLRNIKSRHPIKV